MGSEFLFIDTGAFYAFYDKNDSQHTQVKNTLLARPEEFITSNYVLDELVTLFKARKIDVSQFKDFVDSLWSEKICQLLRVTTEIDLLAWEMMKKYSDQNFSFTDCTSFVLMNQNKIKKVVL